MMIGVSIDIIGQVCKYLDCRSRMNLRHVCRLYYSNISILGLDLSKITDIKSLAEYNDLLYEYTIPLRIMNPVIIKGDYYKHISYLLNIPSTKKQLRTNKMGETISWSYALCCLFDIIGASNLRVIENMFVKVYSNSEDDDDNDEDSDNDNNDNPDDVNAYKEACNNILIAIYHDSPFEDCGRCINLKPVKPYVLIFDMVDSNSCCKIDGSNIQIYQKANNMSSISYVDGVNPYVFILRLEYEESISSMFGEYCDNECIKDMTNLKCLVIMDDEEGDYEDIYKSRKYLANIAKNIPTLNEIHYIACAGDRDDVIEGNDDIDYESIEDIDYESSEDINCLKFMKITYIYSDHDSKYTECMYSKCTKGYTPSILSKIDRIDYHPSMSDLFALYNHFEIPMDSRMKELFTLLGEDMN